MDIAKNLANLRKEHHLTQEQMAEKMQMSKNGYAKLERGEIKITIEHLQNIAQVFNIDMVDLLREHQDVNFLFGDNYTNFSNHYYDSNKEIEKLQLIIAHKDELLAQKDIEIQLLRQLLQQNT